MNTIYNMSSEKTVDNVNISCWRIKNMQNNIRSTIVYWMLTFNKIAVGINCGLFIMFHKTPDKKYSLKYKAWCWHFHTICCNPCRTCWRKLLREPRCLLVSRRAEHDRSPPQFMALAIQNSTSVSETASIFSSLWGHTQIKATIGKNKAFWEWTFSFNASRSTCVDTASFLNFKSVFLIPERSGELRP